YAFGWWNRGETYLRMGNYDKSLADLNKAVELDPNSSYALMQRGNAKRGKKDFPGAIADLTASLKILNNSSYALMYRGLTYTEIGKTAEAQADFDAALKLSPRLKPEIDQELARLKSGSDKPKASK